MPVFLLWFLRREGGGGGGEVRWGEDGGGIREGGCRLVIVCIFLLLRPPLIVLSFTRACRRRITYTLTLSLHTLYVHYLLCHTHKHKGSHKKRAVKLISTPPLSCVCPIHCHIITLCMIILLNLSRIKHASHKGAHLYANAAAIFCGEMRFNL